MADLLAIGVFHSLSLGQEGKPRKAASINVKNVLERLDGDREQHQHEAPAHAAQRPAEAFFAGAVVRGAGSLGALDSSKASAMTSAGILH